MVETSFVIAVILMAFVFDFINGFHDAANSIATIVATCVLTPLKAVMWAAFFNFIAFLVFHLNIAQTIGHGLVIASVMNSTLICSALLSAITWGLVTWFHGMPSSSSHALIGGLVGGALSCAGLSALNQWGLIKVVAGMVVAPIVGMFVGGLMMMVFSAIVRAYPHAAWTRYFRYIQLASSALLSLTHGGNDAQKTMGIVASLLFSASWLGETFYVPFWVIISSQLTISLGTLAGGWRIVRVMGTEITDLNPIKGSAAETSAALVIYAATDLGIPLSTTHTVTGAITGVGFEHRLNMTFKPVIKRILLTWLLTLPSTALMAAMWMKIIS